MRVDYVFSYNNFNLYLKSFNFYYGIFSLRSRTNKNPKTKVEKFLYKRQIYYDRKHNFPYIHNKNVRKV